MLSDWGTVTAALKMGSTEMFLQQTNPHRHTAAPVRPQTTALHWATSKADYIPSEAHQKQNPHHTKPSFLYPKIGHYL